MLKYANSRFTNLWGDGLKAFTVVDYHVRQDSTYSWYEGMNYPYGEHAIPGATQPFFSNLLKFINNNIVDLSDYTFGILHFALVFALIFSGLLLYLIFRKLKLPWWYAGVLAIGIAFLGPQNTRIAAGHPGLAHSYVVPLMIYLLLLFHEKRTWQRCLVLAISTMAFSMVHFYYFGIAALFVGLYFFFDLLGTLKWKKFWEVSWQYGLMILLPFLIFNIWLWTTDPVIDRCSNPWGFSYYKSSWEGILINKKLSIWPLIHDNLIKIRETQMEGDAYVGLAVGVGFVIALVRWIIARFKKPFFRNVPSESAPFLNRIFGASVLLLLFALGLPFIIPSLESLENYIGPLRQFRSVGRFAWVFFYVLNIVFWVNLYHFASKHEHIWKSALAVACVVTLLVEANQFQNYKTYQMREIPTTKVGKRFTDYPIDYSKYQASVPIPYYNIGSDNFWYAPKGMVLQQSLILANQTGLPTTGGMLTRTSRAQTMKQLELIAEPYRVPSILADLSDQRSLLLLRQKGVKDKAKSKFAHFYKDDWPILKENAGVHIIEVPFDYFQKRTDDIQADIKNALSTAELVQHGGISYKDSLERVAYFDYEEKAPSKSYFGNGGFEGRFGEGQVIVMQELPNVILDTLYELSFWLDCTEDRHSMTVLKLEEINQNGYPIQTMECYPRFGVKHVDGQWVMGAIQFKLAATDSFIKVTMRNNNVLDERIRIDELLIRPKHLDVYQRRDGKVWRNGLWFEE